MDCIQFYILQYSISSFDVGYNRIQKILINFLHEKKNSKISEISNGPEKAKELMDKNSASTINAILLDLNLMKYSHCFHNINFQEFKELSDGDLKNLGISLIGPRRKLSSKIDSLKLKSTETSTKKCD